MQKKLYIVLIVASCIHQISINALGKLATSAALGGSAAALAWMGSRYGYIKEQSEYLSGRLEKMKVADPLVQSELKKYFSTCFPGAEIRNISYCEYPKSHSNAEALSSTARLKSYIALPEGSIIKQELEPGKVTIGFSTPDGAWAVRRELTRIINYHSHGKKIVEEIFSNSAVGLSAVTFAACAKNLHRPLPRPIKLVALALAPLYYGIRAAKDEHQQSYFDVEAEKYAIKKSSDGELLFYLKKYRPYEDFDSLASWYYGEISWNSFYHQLTRLDKREIYDMIIDEIEKRPGLNKVSIAG